eukprot:jgi/Chlat1/2288/Chrsp17S00166
MAFSKVLIAVVALLAVSSAVEAQTIIATYNIAKTVYNKVANVPDPKGQELHKTVYYPPVKAVYTKLTTNGPIPSGYDRPTQNRGEAHVTVLRDVEFARISQYVSFKDIVTLGNNNNIQGVAFTLDCLGGACRVVSGVRTCAYFIVLKTPNTALINIRKKIQSLVVSRGGSAALFNPTTYYPHVTVGFTVQNLNPEQGVIKTRAKTCFAELNFV